MSDQPLRVVIDTNTLLRGILSETSAAAKVRRAAEDRAIIPLLSKPVLDEYRAVLSRPQLLQKFPAITPEKIAFLIQRLLFMGEYVRIPAVHFEYRRDPLDAKFIELAIELKATHIVSADKDPVVATRGAMPRSVFAAGFRAPRCLKRTISWQDMAWAKLSALSEPFRPAFDSAFASFQFSPFSPSRRCDGGESFWRVAIKGAGLPGLLIPAGRLIADQQDRR